MSLASTALVTLIQAKNYLRIDSAASLHVDAEYVGMGDGETKAFSLDNTPIDGSLKLYVNGTLQTETTHFTISGADITFVTAPTLNHPVTASYDYSASSDTFESYDDDILERIIEAATEKAESYTGKAFIQREITEAHRGEGQTVLYLFKRPVVSISSVSYEYAVTSTGDGSTTAFDLGKTPKSGSLSVYVDGTLQTETTDYTLSGDIVTFTSAPADDTHLTFKFNIEMDMDSDYYTQLHVGRLTGSWYSGYEYEITYTAGEGADRDAAQTAVPNAVLAVLLIAADLYEARSDRASSIGVAGAGTRKYDMPSRAVDLLNPLRVRVC